MSLSLLVGAVVFAALLGWVLRALARYREFSSIERRPWSETHKQFNDPEDK